ncbi:c-type cytochrome [Hymenobacter humi]|uniref:C-type cytochrome n=1 Tax=Hymenobacter humi TaxID=1411620 RepID=A0ABW2UEC9_9BACT
MKVLSLKLRGLAVALATSTLLLAAACGGNDNTASESAGTTSASETDQRDEAAVNGTAATPATPAASDGPALITKADLKLSPTVDASLAAKGKSMYELKCQSCHSLGENKVVGPGWKGITTRREPEWIMNMVVHTEAMLEKDPAAQKMLEECLVRMPNQNLSQDEARGVLEFMRTLDKK